MAGVISRLHQLTSGLGEQTAQSGENAWLHQLRISAPQRTGMCRPAAIVDRLLQLRVLCLGFLEDGDVGVGVFPEHEEVLVCRLRLGGVACHRVRPPDLKMCQ
jgi:hypothetical protein